MTKSHSENGRYLCRFHPFNEIFVRLYEVFETSKKQDLSPLKSVSIKKEKMLAVKGKNKQKGLLVGNPAQPAQQELSIF